MRAYSEVSPTDGRKFLHVRVGHGVAPRTDFFASGGTGADHAGRAVDREVHAGLQHHGRDHRHHRDERFHHHRAVADQARVALVLEHLGRRARRDQRMEAGDRAACDGDEREREHFAAEDRTHAVGELGQRRHQRGRMQRDDAERERHDRSDFDERRKIVARREQQPDRQHRGEEAVRDYPNRQRRRFHHEVVPDAPALDVAPAEYREQDEADAERRALDEAARPQMRHVDADEHRDRHGGRDGRGRPRAMLHRVDHDQAEHRDQDHHDHQHANQRGEAADRSDFLGRHPAERAAVALQRVAEDHEILDASAEHRADDDPDGRRQIAELCGQHRADQRTGAGDRGEMMAEGDPLLGRHVVAAVVQADRRRNVRVVEFKHAVGDESRVETIAEGVNAHRRDDEPEHARPRRAPSRARPAPTRRARRLQSKAEYELASRERIYHKAAKTLRREGAPFAWCFPFGRHGDEAAQEARAGCD